MTTVGAALVIPPSLVMPAGSSWPGTPVALEAGAVQRHVMLLHRSAASLSTVARALHHALVEAAAWRFAKGHQARKKM